MNGTFIGPAFESGFAANFPSNMTEEQTNKVVDIAREFMAIRSIFTYGSVIVLKTYKTDDANVIVRYINRQLTELKHAAKLYMKLIQANKDAIDKTMSEYQERGEDMFSFTVYPMVRGIAMTDPEYRKQRTIIIAIVVIIVVIVLAVIIYCLYRRHHISRIGYPGLP